jgi:hypothetical protein
MNIFVVDNNPMFAAADLCDQHVSKMHTESVQLLVSLLNNLEIEHNVKTKAGSKHKGGYPNHPCCKWLEEDYQNVEWLLRHAFELCFEHQRRFGKMPFSYSQLNHWVVYRTVVNACLPDNGMTAHPQCMPEECRSDDAVDAYRAYYIEHKSSMAQWRHCDPPSWYSEAFDYAGVSL